MHMIYVDEAGTSDHEPFRVVAGIQISSSAQWKAVAQEIENVRRKFLGEELTSDFVFHAKEIFNGGKTISREKWPFEQRLEYFKQMLAIPRRFNCVIHVGATKAHPYAAQPFGEETKITRSEMDHIFSFMQMVSACNRWMIKNLPASELAVLICEAIPHRAKNIKLALRMLQTSPIHFGPEHFADAGDGHSENFIGGASKIIDSVHFAEKQDALMLQLADAAAFAFRRRLAKLPEGENLLTALIGEVQLSPYWWDPGNSSYSFAR